MTARLSMRQAINAKCKDCIYDPLARGTWREQAAGCSSSSCPLFPLRPLPINAKRGDQGEPDDVEAGEGSDCDSPAEDLAETVQSSA